MKPFCEKCGNKRRKLTELTKNQSINVFGTTEKRFICKPCLKRAERIAKIMNLEEY